MEKSGLTENSAATESVLADAAVADAAVADAAVADAAVADAAVADAAVAAADAIAPDAHAGRAEVMVAQSSSDSETPTIDQLEREGDIAADYIEEFLDICDLDGDIDIDARNGRAYLSVKASDADNLRVLSKPETVTALQELTRLAVQNKTGAFSRLILDIGGSREAREAELATLVGRAIERIEAGASDADLPAMSSYERKLVHDIVAARGYKSESSGEGRDRHTVITAS